MRRWWARRIAGAGWGERGQVLVIGALLMVGLTGFLGLVVDASNGYAARRQTQNAADAASYAAAEYLGTHASPTDSDVQAVITRYGTPSGVSINFSPGVCSSPPNCGVGAWYISNVGGVIDTVAGYVGSGVIPPGAVGVRVFPSKTVNTFFIGVLGYKQINASAASARIYGSTKSLSTWMPSTSFTLSSSTSSSSATSSATTTVWTSTSTVTSTSTTTGTTVTTSYSTSCSGRGSRATCSTSTSTGTSTTTGTTTVTSTTTITGTSTVTGSSSSTTTASSSISTTTLPANYSQTGIAGFPVIISLADYNSQTNNQTQWNVVQRLAPKSLGSGGFDWSGLLGSLGANTVSDIITGNVTYTITIGTTVDDDSGTKDSDCHTLSNSSWVNKIVWIPLVSGGGGHAAVVQSFAPFFYTGSNCSGSSKTMNGFWVNPALLPPFPNGGVNTSGSGGIISTGGIP